ncbi:uncharacterized protein HKW66_Vig0200670 [Vigna angularis]|uniref:Leucine-rich repeat-containing N-terminal plant-type domain-containing protein n=1 Tax=Phaseolus angularis TaxID=3914 RepID=A0A8T0JR09_PHAAN|nr:uncharacterized protein HKW66_Vig0200670 [Vigna angularis]
MPLFWLCLCNELFVVSGLCHDDQRSLLLQLKNNLTYTFESSTKVKSWNPTNDCCGWIGLKLENPNLQKLVRNLTSIRQLYLDGVSISAAGHEWSSALMSLHDLQEVRMSWCNLSGPLDPSLGSLENLSVIVLDVNNLSSTVPETFAYLKFLTILSLSSCQLTGTFPQNIFKIVTLSIVDISLNSNLKGFFPDFPQGSLQTLRVSNTSFSGAFPNSIGNMKNLTELDFSCCLFSGALPNSLSNLTELSYLDLSYNNFTGRIPSFEMVNKLTYLRLSDNGLSGAVPSSSHFEGLNNLVTIDLGYNSISGSIPSSLFTLPQLQNIMLSHNQFGQLDKFTNVSSSKLKLLDLSSNNLSGSFPISIYQLSRLYVLILSSNKLNGTMNLDKLSELIKLDLSYNNLSVDVNVANADPSYFPTIYDLRLVSCNLKTFPAFLRNHSTISFLDLSDNHIQGIVPNWIWKLPNLENLNISHNLLTHLEGPFQNFSSKFLELDLHHNKLQGPIPFFPARGLYLDLSNNKFNSVIPRDIGNYLSSTIVFSLSNNTLSGTIPDSLCNSSNLQFLDLSNNNISGTIPWCLMKMSKTLELLNLRKNSLMGPVPDKFSAAFLDLSFNHLVGKIPTGTQLQSFPASSFQGNDGLYGPPLTEEQDGTEPGVLQEHQATVSTIDWNFISVEVGLIFGHGMIFGPLLFWKQWRIWYWKVINKILCWIFPQLYFEYATKRGQTYATLRWQH